MDGIARGGGADGVARLACGRLADIDGAALGARAAAKARAGGRPIELPPGRYEVVLEPEAVADLLQNLATFGFNGKAYAQRQSFAELGAAAVRPRGDHRATIARAAPGCRSTPRARRARAVALVDAGATVGVTHDRTLGGRGRRGVDRARAAVSALVGPDRHPPAAGRRPDGTGQRRHRATVARPPTPAAAAGRRRSSAGCSSPTCGTPGCSTRRAW